MTHKSLPGAHCLKKWDPLNFPEIKRLSKMAYCTVCYTPYAMRECYTLTRTLVRTTVSKTCARCRAGAISPMTAIDWEMRKLFSTRDYGYVYHGPQHLKPAASTQKSAAGAAEKRHYVLSLTAGGIRLRSRYADKAPRRRGRAPFFFSSFPPSRCVDRNGEAR